MKKYDRIIILNGQPHLPVVECWYPGTHTCRIKLKMLKKFGATVNQYLNCLGYEITRNPVDFDIRDPFRQQQLFYPSSQPLTIFDIGTYVGDITQKYRRLFPDATIHAFEPFNNSYKVSKERFGQDTNTIINQLAVADHVGTVTFYANRDSATNSLLQSDEKGEEYWGSGLLETRECIQVPTITIDAYCAQHQIEKIDILKLDIQGGELAALKGGEALLEKKGVGLVYTEIITAPTYRGQPSFHKLVGFLEGYGLYLFNIYHMQYKQNRLIQFDAIFLNSVIFT